jgi:serine/threonine-protein kinase
MGAVYRAWDTRLDILVAIKEMFPQAGLDQQKLAQLRNQFQQEAKVLAKLDHPHLVDVTDFFSEGGQVYLVMKYIEGESLATRIEKQGALPEEEVLAWADQLLSSLAYCHAQGIIHRDVKPQNVILRLDGQAVLVDFGLVKLWDPDDPHTRTAIRSMGTPQYAPPEQYDAHLGHTDARSDIYSLGATLYHALSGQAPPTATQRVVDPTVLAPLRTLNPQLNPGVEAAVMRALALQPAGRYRGAADMAIALRGRSRSSVHPGAPDRQAMKARPGKRPPAPTPEPRRGLPVWVWAAGGLVGLVLLVLVTGLVIGIVVGAGKESSQQVTRNPTASLTSPASIAPARQAQTEASRTKQAPTFTPATSSTIAPAKSESSEETPPTLPPQTATPAPTSTAMATATNLPSPTQDPLPSPTPT